MIRLALVAAPAALIGAAACSALSAPNNATNRAEANVAANFASAGPLANQADIPQRDRDCLARGGRPAVAGLSGESMCAEPLADAGKSCQSSSDCAGDCILAPKPDQPRPEPGQPAAGVCQSFNYPYGCREQVEDGRFIGTLCVD